MKRVALALGSMLIGAALLAPSADAATVFAVNQGANQQIVSFDTATPGTFDSQVFLQGLAPNEQLVGIDVRPRDRQIYGIGSTGRLYQVNYETGATRLVAQLTSGGQPVLLDGGFFGVDFNPTVDRIRVVSNLGQNLRINPNDGVTIVDGTLSYPATPTVLPSITASAYANNVDGATTTTLFGIDTLLNEVVQSTNANAGTYARNNLPITGANPTEITGFDIETGTGIAFAAFRPMPGSSTSSFYTINLANGQAALVGMVGRQEENFVVGGITLGPAVVPEPGTLVLLSLGGIALAGRRRRK